MSSLDQLGGNTNLTEDPIERTKGFIRAMLYNGKENECYIDTRRRICDALKKKSLLCLPPNPDSVGQAVKRVYPKSSTWLQCTSQTIISLSS